MRDPERPWENLVCPLTVFVPEEFPRLTPVDAAPAMLTVVELALKRFEVALVVVRDPPLTATFPAAVRDWIEVELFQNPLVLL